MPLQAGGGGLASTAADYARFLHMIVSGGTLDGRRILSPATLAFMMSDHLAPEVGNNLDILPEGYGFGLGFAVRRAYGIAPFPGLAGRLLVGRASPARASSSIRPSSSTPS